MTLAVHLLNGRVVGIFVRDKEGTLDHTAVRVVAAFFKDLVVKIDVVVVDGIVESDCDHLRNCVRLELSGNLSSIDGAETVGENALRLVARRSAIGVLVDGAGVFVGSIRAVRGSVTEFFLLDTIAVPAGQLSGLTDGFVGRQQRSN